MEGQFFEGKKIMNFRAQAQAFPLFFPPASVPLDYLCPSLSDVSPSCKCHAISLQKLSQR